MLKKALKPLVMAGVASTVALSLVVTTPSNAHAFVAPVLPVVAGAAEVAGVAVAITPVGWAVLGATALGVGLYATKDYWLPYVTGAFGNATNGSQPTVNASSQQWHSITTFPELSGDKTTLSVHYFGAARGGSRDWMGIYEVIGHCVNAAGKTGYYQTFQSQMISPGMTLDHTFNAVPCPYGYTVTGWIAGGGQGSSEGTYTPNLDTSNPQPVQFNSLGTVDQSMTKNVYRGGDMDHGTPGFDPKSAKTKYRVEVECIADDGTKSFANGYSTGDMAGVVFPSCAAQGKGHATGNVKIYATPPDTTTEQTAPIWSATPKAPDPATPLCDSTRAGSGCKLAVQLDNQPCVTGLFACEHWADLSKDPNWAPRFSCQYGPYAVALSQCNPLERAYEPGGVPATEKNTDGDPATRDDAQPDGSTTPRTGGTTSTVPGGAGAPAPAPAPSGSPDAQGQECFPNGWAVFNPVEWVMKPVGCALQAAFVPKQQTMQTQTTRIQDKIKNAGPGKVITAWQATFESVGGGSGCAGPSVVFSMEGYNQTMRPFDACSGGMATAASVSFAVSSVMIVIFGGLGIARAASSAFGFNFGFGKGASGS